MLKHDLKIVARRIRQQPGFAAVHLLGLAVGIGCCLLIALFVLDEWRYDAFHHEPEQIYRIITHEQDENVSRKLANAYFPLADLLHTAVPEMQEVVRYFPYSLTVHNPANGVRHQEAAFVFADSLFFDLFNFRFLAGNAATALRQPRARAPKRSGG